MAPCDNQGQTGIGPGSPSPRGFTLVEVLVVVTIIVILIGILLPALSASRASTRKAATTSLMSGVSAAIQQFRVERDRQPGYFTQQQMGQQANETVGLTQMENAILELAGGTLAEFPSGNRDNLIVITLTSQPGDSVIVDLTKIGASDGPGYLSLGADVLRAVEGQYHGAAGGGDQGTGGNQAPNIARMPDIVDPFNMPLMLWTKNTLAGSNPDFARMNADGGRALFYWSSNAGYLRAIQLGRDKRDQAHFSVLGRRPAGGFNPGYPQASNTDIVSSMQALLGHPDLPKPTNSGSADDPDLEPSAPLADAVLHSAGVDGYFLGNDARRLRNQALLRANYQRNGSVPARSKPIDRFDDITVPAG